MEFALIAELAAYLRDVPEGQGFELAFDVEKITFHPIAQGGAEESVAASAAEWREALAKRGLVNAYALYGQTEQEIEEQGFTYSRLWGVLTVFADGRKTYWTPVAERTQWTEVEREFKVKRWWMERTVRRKEKWPVYSVDYTEREVTGAPADWPKFTDCSEELARVYKELAELCDDIGEKYFGGRFREGYRVLTDEAEPGMSEQMRKHFPKMTGAKLRLYNAALCARVFGGMGSWNDVPAGRAEAANRSDDYRRLSAELARYGKMAEMYAAN